MLRSCSLVFEEDGSMVYVSSSSSFVDAARVASEKRVVLRLSAHPGRGGEANRGLMSH